MKSLDHNAVVRTLSTLETANPNPACAYEADVGGSLSHIHQVDVDNLMTPAN